MAQPAQSRGLLRFGVFEVDTRSGELHKQGLKVRLQDQPFRVLAMLLERPGEVVTREELRRKLWPADTFVDFEDGLNTAINKLRQALGDSAENPRFVETLPRRGYRFIGLVDSPPPVEPSSAAIGSGQGEPVSGLPGVGAAGAQTLGGRELSPDTGAATAPAVSAHEAGVIGTEAAKPRFYAFLAFVGLAALLVVVLGFNISGLRQRLFGKPLAAPSIQSIAVLPLENLTGDPSQDYFVDGMTDELIAELAKINALRVISRTSVMRYKGVKKPLPEIARELGVDALVEGTVLRSGDRVRVTANLVQAMPERHLWAQEYERDLRDVLALQSDVATAITREIRIKLTPQEQVRLASARPVNPEAHEAYLKGRYYWNKRTAEGFHRAIKYFSEATEKDPNYALAHAGLADGYILLEYYSLLPAKEAYPKAREAATRALELDDTLAEAHNALAGVKWGDDWDWPGAEREFRRAIELNPGYATAHQWYGELLSILGRHEEALTEVKRAQQLDPLSLIINTISGWNLLAAGRDDLAIEQLRKTLEMEPNFSLAHYYLGWAYVRKGQFAEAIAEFQRATDITWYKGGLGHAYARAGKSAEALKLLCELKEQSKQRNVSWCDFAAIYGGLGEKDQAFASLEKAYEQRDSRLPWMKGFPLFDPLHSDPRFADLVRRMGLPQ